METTRKTVHYLSEVGGEGGYNLGHYYLFGILLILTPRATEEFAVSYNNIPYGKLPDDLSVLPTASSQFEQFFFFTLQCI